MNFRQKLYEGSKEEKANPSVAVDLSDNIHLVWSDYTPGNKEIVI